ncbi:MAG: peptidoglycan-binding protein [Cyanobacteria bacterium J06635_15]
MSRATLSKKTLAILAIAMAGTELASNDTTQASSQPTVASQDQSLNVVPDPEPFCRDCLATAAEVGGDRFKLTNASFKTNTKIRWSKSNRFDFDSLNSNIVPSPLAIGSSGTKILHVQKLLNQRGFETPMDGVFDAKTYRALVRFQSVYGLDSNGILEVQTVAALQNSNQPPPTPSPEAALSVEIIKEGSRGKAVKQVQRLLVYQGYVLEIDGEFGQETRLAVLQFQTTHNLSADGIVGTTTMRALLAASHI